MTNRLLPLLAALALLGACAERAVTAPMTSAPWAAPRGATLGSQGFVTVTDVPATPYPADPPPEPAEIEDTIGQFARENRLSRSKAEAAVNGSPAFQAELARLQQILRQSERDNFVGMRIIRDPAVAAEVRFKRDAARTLARYTSNPLFRPSEGGLSELEIDRLREVWTARLQKRRLGGGLGGDPAEGVLRIDLGITEAEFQAIAAEEGWTWGDDVRFDFALPAPPPFADPALARLVRVFPRSAQAAGIILTSATFGRVVLDGGCFRLGSSKGPLLLFDRGAQLDRDAQGYLVIRDGREQREYRDGRARIGETAVWGGYPAPVESDPDVLALRRQCGVDHIVSIGIPLSVTLFGLPDPTWVADYSRKRKLGFSEAWHEVIACMKRENARGRLEIHARDRCVRQFN